MCLKSCIEFQLSVLLQIMTLLEDESMTVEDCGIEENQSILIEGRFNLNVGLPKLYVVLVIGVPQKYYKIIMYKTL